MGAELGALVLVDDALEEGAEDGGIDGRPILIGGAQDLVGQVVGQGGHEFVIEQRAVEMAHGEHAEVAAVAHGGEQIAQRVEMCIRDSYKIEGDLEVNGKKQRFGHPEEAIQAGVAYVSEDRKRNGLILIQDVRQNTTLANLKSLAARLGVIDANAEIKVANEYKKSLNIKTPSIQQRVSNLSGGNQQKVSLAKWLFVSPNILILDEPTRGIDVGAKFEIYTLMNQLVEQGLSILMISSELPEVLGMSDRVYVMSVGEITGELAVEEANQEKIMHLATRN